MTKRDILNDIVNELTDEQVNRVYSLINLSAYASKGDIIKLFYKDAGTYDSAYPIDHYRQIEQVYPNIKSAMLIGDYTNGHYELVNVNDKVLTVILDFLKEIR